MPETSSRRSVCLLLWLPVYAGTVGPTLGRSQRAAGPRPSRNHPRDRAAHSLPSHSGEPTALLLSFTGRLVFCGFWVAFIPASPR